MACFAHVSPSYCRPVVVREMTLRKPPRDGARCCWWTVLPLGCCPRSFPRRRWLRFSFFLQCPFCRRTKNWKRLKGCVNRVVHINVIVILYTATNEPRQHRAKGVCTCAVRTCRYTSHLTCEGSSNGSLDAHQISNEKALVFYLLDLRPTSSGWCHQHYWWWRWATRRLRARLLSKVGVGRLQTDVFFVLRHSSYLHVVND